MVERRLDAAMQFYAGDGQREEILTPIKEGEGERRATQAGQYPRGRSEPGRRTLQMQPPPLQPRGAQRPDGEPKREKRGEYPPGTRMVTHSPMHTSGGLSSLPGNILSLIGRLKTDDYLLLGLIIFMIKEDCDKDVILILAFLFFSGL